MKNIKLHVCVMLMIVIAELIGVKSFSVGPGKIVLLPMLYALIIGIFTTPRFLNIMKQKEMEDASSLIGLTLMLLMARYGTLVGPTLPKIISASPALILQEFGNLGTVLVGVPLAVFFGLKRETIGAAHSIAREPNIALVGERYGLDTPEGRGVMGVYISGTVFGTIFFWSHGQFLRCPWNLSSLRACHGIWRWQCKYDVVRCRCACRHVSPDGRPAGCFWCCQQYALWPRWALYVDLARPAAYGIPL